MDDARGRPAITGVKSLMFQAVLGIAIVCSLVVISSNSALSQTPSGKCISLRTYCQGKGWVTSSCDATNPCGSSSGASSTDSEAARTLGTALGQAVACKLFGQGCAAHADNAGARANYYNLSEIQRARLVEALAGQDAASAAAQQRVNVVLDGGSTGGLTLLDLNAKESPTKSQTGTKQGTAAQEKAWKQLHCAAEIAGFALKALEQRGDYDAFGDLSTEALKALDGQGSVTCTPTPPFPSFQGHEVGMEQAKAAQERILSRAKVIAEGMKQRGDKPAVLSAIDQTAKETPDEKIRRVQRELNQANSQKITGKTQQEIDQQERDRRELAKLILDNSHLEKGELTSVVVDIPQEDPAPK